MSTFKYRAIKLKAHIRKGIQERRLARHNAYTSHSNNESQNRTNLIREMWDNYLTFTGLGI